MLEITIKGFEFYDENLEEFKYEEDTVVKLEHSLVSLSKWESRWETPFLAKDEKTTEQTLDYIWCMCLDEKVDPKIFDRIDSETADKIQQYISAKKTATWFTDTSNKRPNSRTETITSELIYYWMVAMQIPWECQEWHLNRLLTLIEVCNRKNEKPKKASKADQMARNRELNKARRAQMNSSG